MLGVSSYPQAFVDGCRQRLDTLLRTYDELQAAAGADAGDAASAFEAQFFANLVLVLDHSFMHRLRGVEGKDGNPLNEVRLLTGSLLEHDGVLTAEKTIKYDAGRAVVGIALGDEIRLDEKSFRLLADAYFAEIEKRFPPA
ncbi:MAG TPA: hypothetical protein VGO78_16675 [Acidimicrobiales bacterium]|nr:hypothetical protein [Acidimicrobiales bacterium]